MVDGGSWMFMEGDEFWVQKGAELVLVRVDPQTGREEERFENIPGFTVAKDGDTVWGFDESGNVVRVDMATGEDLASIDVPEQPKQIVLAAMPSGLPAMPEMRWCGSIPVPQRSPTRSTSATDRSSSSLDSIPCGSATGSPNLFRVDPETAEVIATIDGFGSSPSLGLSFGGGLVWASALGPAMAAIDPSTNALAYEIPLPNTRYMDSYWIDGELWVSTAFDQRLLQVNAARP